MEYRLQEAPFPFNRAQAICPSILHIVNGSRAVHRFGGSGLVQLYSQTFEIKLEHIKKKNCCAGYLVSKSYRALR